MIVSVATLMSHTRSQRGVALAIMAVLAGWWGFVHYYDWRYVCSGILIALGLYYIRLRVRFLYALIEILFGIVVLSGTSPKVEGGFSEEFSAEFARPSVEFSFAASIAAIYIIVRGLDNMKTGIDDYVRKRQSGKHT